jgi:hypothetical protein
MAPLRLRYLAMFLNNYRKLVWEEMHGDYDPDIDIINAVAHEGDMAIDVTIFNIDLMEELHVRAFKELYSISIEEASDILRKLCIVP